MRVWHVFPLIAVLATAARAQAPALAASDKVYAEAQVDRPAMKKPGTLFPQYPEALKAAGIQGEVLAQFVVDVDGTPILDTFKVIKTTNAAFANAVKAALPEMRFAPAELKGQKVRQLYQTPFVFAMPSKAAPHGPQGIQSATPRHH